MANHLFNVSDDLDDRTFQHMHVPCLKDDISMAGPRAFVKIIHLYLRTADIWICWFGRFAFVKPSSLHLQTCDINASFGASLDFSRNNVCISPNSMWISPNGIFQWYFPTPIICICRRVISTFVRVSRLLLTTQSPSLTIEFGVAFVNKQLKKNINWKL